MVRSPMSSCRAAFSGEVPNDMPPVRPAATLPFASTATASSSTLPVHLPPRSTSVTLGDSRSTATDGLPSSPRSAAAVAESVMPVLGRGLFTA